MKTTTKIETIHMLIVIVTPIKIIITVMMMVILMVIMDCTHSGTHISIETIQISPVAVVTYSIFPHSKIIWHMATNKIHSAITPTKVVTMQDRTTQTTGSD